MKTVIQNLTGNPVPLPQVCNNGQVLAPNAIATFSYVSMSSGDLAKLVALALSTTISFPGDPGNQIDRGLPYRSTGNGRTYALNGQEPLQVVVNDSVGSIDDNANRICVYRDEDTGNCVWATDKEGYFVPGKTPTPDTTYWAPRQQLKDGTITMFGSDYDDGGTGPSLYDQIVRNFNPSTETWTTKATALPDGMQKCQSALLKNGDVLLFGGDYPSTLQQSSPSGSFSFGTDSVAMLVATGANNGGVLLNSGGALDNIWQSNFGSWPAGFKGKDKVADGGCMNPDGTFPVDYHDDVKAICEAFVNQMETSNGPVATNAVQKAAVDGSLFPQNSSTPNVIKGTYPTTEYAGSPANITGIDSGYTATATRYARSFVYRPKTDTYYTIASMPASVRFYGAPTNTPIVLDNGKVLVAGGYDPAALNGLYAGSMLFTPNETSPGSGTWASSGVMPAPVADNAMVKLNTGDVLSVGGLVSGANGALDYTRACAKYDHVAGTWAATAPMPACLDDDVTSGYSDAANTGAGNNPGNRVGASVCVVNNGDVLVAGGWCGYAYGSAAFIAAGNDIKLAKRKSALMFDHESFTWTVLNPMNARRGFAPCALTDPEEVTVVSGSFYGTTLTDAVFNYEQSAEIYDQDLNQWSIITNDFGSINTYMATVGPFLKCKDKRFILFNLFEGITTGLAPQNVYAALSTEYFFPGPKFPKHHKYNDRGDDEHGSCGTVKNFTNGKRTHNG